MDPPPLSSFGIIRKGMVSFWTIFHFLEKMAFKLQLNCQKDIRSLPIFLFPILFSNKESKLHGGLVQKRPPPIAPLQVMNRSSPIRPLPICLLTSLQKALNFLFFKCISSINMQFNINLKRSKLVLTTEPSYSSENFHSIRDAASHTSLNIEESYSSKNILSNI